MQRKWHRIHWAFSRCYATDGRQGLFLALFLSHLDFLHLGRSQASSYWSWRNGCSRYRWPGHISRRSQTICETIWRACYSKSSLRRWRTWYAKDWQRKRGKIIFTSFVLHNNIFRLKAHSIEHHLKHLLRLEMDHFLLRSSLSDLVILKFR